jgi:hypothetical protein
MNFDITSPGYRLVSNQYRREWGKDYDSSLTIEI